MERDVDLVFKPFIHTAQQGASSCKKMPRCTISEYSSGGVCSKTDNTAVSIFTGIYQAMGNFL
jgi:hypothetical protein